VKVLLHICCGPCAIVPFEELSDQGHQVTGYFYNPNVHPLIEFRRRLKAAKVLQERVPIEVIYEEDYGLEEFLEAVAWEAGAPERCRTCYRLRLERAAHRAAEGDFDAFTTTLLGSTHQHHRAVLEVGRESARRHGVDFVEADWRPRAGEGHERAGNMQLYRQSYCGCIFSEYERFRDTTRHLYRGGG
jgi:hypothetical protein